MASRAASSVVGGDGVHDLAVGVDGLLIDALVIETAEELHRVGDHRQQLGNHRFCVQRAMRTWRASSRSRWFFSGVDQILDLPAKCPQLRHIFLRGVLGRQKATQGSIFSRMSSSSWARRSWSGM